MTKILLVIFSIFPLYCCFILGFTYLNAYKITESLSYFCLITIAINYFYLGLKEIFIKN